jgi:hypothetical protein
MVTALVVQQPSARSASEAADSNVPGRPVAAAARAAGSTALICQIP